MKITILASLFFSLIIPAAHAEEEHVADGELLSRYWLEEPLTLAATIGLPNHLFSVSVNESGAQNDKQKNIDYSPPQATDLTLTAGYGPFQFSWKLPLPQSASSKSTYGKSNYDDFSLEFGRGRYATSLYYQNFGGFYTDLNGNTGNFSRIGSGSNDSGKNSGGDTFGNGAASTTSAPQDILKRPDIHSKHYGAIAWYSVPLKGENAQAFQISFRTLYDKPDPGFNLDLVTSLFYDRAQISGSAPFVPVKKAATFGKGASLKGVDMHSAGAGAGLASSYVFESSNFFLDGLFLYGGGVQRHHAEFTEDSRWNTVYVDNVNMKMGVNYRGEKEQGSLHFWVNDLGSRVSDIRFNSSNMAIELGYSHTI